MIEVFRQMLLGVSAAAICGGVAMLLAGGGALREIIRLAAGLAVLLAVLEPLSGLRLPDVAGAVRRAAGQAQAQTDEIAAENREVLSSSAMDVTCRYIKRRAAEMGVECRADLDLATDENGILIVTGAHMTCGPANAETMEALKTMVAEECGIPREMQTWNSND